MSDTNFAYFVPELLKRLIVTKSNSLETDDEHNVESTDQHEQEAYQLDSAATLRANYILLPAPGQNTVSGFVQQYQQYGVGDEEELLQACVLMTRLPWGSKLSPRCAPTAFMGLVMLACKMHQDQPYNNASFAQLLNRPVSEVNAIEAQLLRHLRFSASVSVNQCDAMGNAVSKAYEDWAMRMSFPVPTCIAHSTHTAPVAQEPQQYLNV